MLQLPTHKPLDKTRFVSVEEKDGSEYFDLKGIFGAIRRQSKLIFGLSLIGLLIGVVYAATSIPLYSATTSIMIDRRQVRAVQDVSAVTEVGGDAAIAIDSQVEVLKSERIALAVVDQLKLVSDPSFWAREGSLFTSVYQWIDQSARQLAAKLQDRSAPVQDVSQVQNARRWAAARRLLGKTTVARLGKTYIITISIAATDPEQAAAIANAYVEAYFADQLDAKYDATRRANAWLQTRLEELRQQSAQSDSAVQQFRAANQLISVGGQLVTDLQLSELNSQLSVARGEIAQAVAKLERMRTVLTSRDFDALLAEASGDPAFADLRTRYLEASKREAEISARFGADHERALQYRSEKAEITRHILDEAARIMERYESEYQVAKARLEALSQSVDRLISVAAEANNKQVQLRDLEQEAETYRTLYQSFLQRFQQTVQQQSFPMSEARVVTPATPPMQPSHPKTIPIVLLSSLIGSILGGAIGAVREYRDGSFRTGRQVREELGVRCLGILPRVAAPWSRRARGLRAWWGGSPTARRTDAPELLSYVRDTSQSEFAEAVRSIVTMTAHVCSGRHARVIGVTSVAPQEGRTIVAASLAALLAEGGSQTLLIDADIRSPVLTNSLVPDADSGLLDVLAGRHSLGTALHCVAGSDFMMIPAGCRADYAPLSRLITNERFEEFLREASESFEYTIVDLPPLGRSSEARVMASKMDCLLLVISWGRTSKTYIRETLTASDLSGTQCIGAVLNGVDLRSLRLYEEHSSAG